MPRKAKAFICSHFPFQVTVGKQRQFPIRSPCCTYSVPTLCPQRCLSSARAYSEISRCPFRHDTAFDKVCNTALKRALALFSNFSFSCGLEEIWIYRFLKTHTYMCTHAHMHKHTISLHSTRMQLKNCSLHRETGTFGRCSRFRTTWLCHLDWLVLPITTKAYCRPGLKSRASSL